MNAATSRVTRLLATATLTVLFGFTAPLAQAVSPPQIDERWLPEPSSPAPPQPTVQREICAATSTHSLSTSDTAGPAAQLADFDLPQIWQLTRGGGQRVAVIDTGVSRHRRLPTLLAGGDYVSTGDGTQDCDAHGTLVAGIIAASPDAGADNFSGVAPDVTLISIRQSSAKFAPISDPSSTGVGDVNTMAKAVRTAADMGASVINISTVACVAATTGIDDRALGAALAYAVDVKNAVVVAAAGNTGGVAQCPPQRSDATRETVAVVVSPAWYDDYVLTVGSVTADGKPSAFTLAGPWVDVAAPGERVASLGSDNDAIVSGLDERHGSAPLAGTSYAAPVVSGLAALIRARFPAMTARQVMDRIKSTAHHPPAGWDPIVGNGIIDAMAAVSTGSISPETSAKPGPVQENTRALHSTSQQPGSPDHRPRNIAFGGTAICVVALLAALVTNAGRGRSRGQSTHAGHDGVTSD
ncbi:type VII secretion-associated serine protease mycosin [Mycobacterium sp.]|uniref:type VII secretion-associated serine protease mycosin n=1 Tax=Mycobacterium sp. TaxID=1785 RepID=UPI003BAAF1DF